MEIKHLRALLKLLREQGVTEYKTSELSLTLSETTPASLARDTSGDVNEERELSPEEEAERLLFYSATPPLEPSEQ